MGLQKSNKNINYVRMKEGKLFLSTDLENPYDEISGVISNIATRTDKYEGKDIEKLIIDVVSEGVTYSLGINFNTQCASDLLGFLKNADLTQELTLIPLQKTEIKNNEEVKRTSMLVKQDNTFCKKYYTKDSPNGLPPMKQVKLNGKVVWDKTEMMDFFRDMIKTELRPQLVKVETTAPVSTGTSEIEEEEEDFNDDLPF